MRTLGNTEIEQVAGGLNIHVNLVAVEVDMTGQDISAGHAWAVSRMADFFTWWDPAGYYR